MQNFKVLGSSYLTPVTISSLLGARNQPTGVACSRPSSVGWAAEELDKIFPTCLCLSCSDAHFLVIFVGDTHSRDASFHNNITRQRYSPITKENQHNSGGSFSVWPLRSSCSDSTIPVGAETMSGSSNEEVRDTTLVMSMDMDGFMGWGDGSHFIGNTLVVTLLHQKKRAMMVFPTWKTLYAPSWWP